MDQWSLMKKKINVALTSSTNTDKLWGWRDGSSSLLREQKLRGGSGEAEVRHRSVQTFRCASRNMLGTTFSYHDIANYLGVLLANSELMLQSHFTNGTLSAAMQPGKPTRALGGVFGINNNGKNRRGGASLSSRMFSCYVLVLHIYDVLWLDGITQIKPGGNAAVNKLLRCYPLKHQHWAVQSLAVVCQMQNGSVNLRKKNYLSQGTAGPADPMAHLGPPSCSLSLLKSLMLIQSMKHKTMLREMGGGHPQRIYAPLHKTTFEDTSTETRLWKYSSVFAQKQVNWYGWLCWSFNVRLN